MLELFPDGLRGASSAAASVELAAYTDAAGEERLCAARSAASQSSRCRAGLGGPLARVPPAGPGRRALDRAAVGEPPTGRARGRDRSRAARSAPARIRRRGSASSCSQRPRARRACSTSAAAPACSRSRPRSSASRPCVAVDVDPRGRRGDARERRRRTASRSTSRLADAARRRAARRRRRRREHRARRRSRRSRRGSRARASITSGYLAPTSPRSPAGPPSSAASSSSGWAADAATSRAVELPARWRRFSVRFLGCKVSHADAQAMRERLLADGHDEVDAAPGRRRRQHVLRHARGGREVAAGGCARGAHARPRLRDRLRARTSPATRSPGCPRTSPSSRGRARRRPAFVAGDVGAIGCVQADARLDRVRAFVKIQDGCSFSCAFCVIPLVRGATRSRRAEAVLAEIAPPRRAGPPRDRPHRRQPRLLPRPRRRLHAAAARPRGRRDRRASSGCASPRSRSTTSTTSSSRRCARRRPSRRTCTSRSSRATTACCARWAAATRSRTYLREARAARATSTSRPT